MSELTIAVRPFLHPDAQVLVAAIQDDLRRRYDDADGDATPLAPADFDPPRGAFLVGYRDGAPVAAAGWRTCGEDAELKRMYTAEAARGRGYGRQLLRAVEDSARAAGRRRVILETGVKQPEAIGLYESAGYTLIPGFGYYAHSPLARHYGRVL
ncbi:MAG TPA: GNAT family N-acetyltransferase [Pilimelia sp.]|nr:GNAT family N-acetyltransferase [Pilimelia sp.]